MEGEDDTKVEKSASPKSISRSPEADDNIVPGPGGNNCKRPKLETVELVPVEIAGSEPAEFDILEHIFSSSDEDEDQNLNLHKNTKKSALLGDISMENISSDEDENTLSDSVNKTAVCVLNQRPSDLNDAVVVAPPLPLPLPSCSSSASPPCTPVNVNVTKELETIKIPIPSANCSSSESPPVKVKNELENGKIPSASCSSSAAPPVKVKKESEPRTRRIPSVRDSDFEIVDLASDSEDDVQMVSDDKKVHAKATAAGIKNPGQGLDDDDDFSGLEFDGCADAEIEIAPVQMKPLPLYELLDVIVPFRKMEIHESKAKKGLDGKLVRYHLKKFSLSNKACDLISSGKAQVYIRFCQLKNGKKPDNASQELDDHLPDELELNINDVLSYPKMSAYFSKEGDKELGSMDNQSIDITNDIHWSPEKRNHVEVSWWHYPTEDPYAVGVSIWKPLNVDELFENIKSTAPEDTLKKIQDIINTSTDCVDVSAPNYIKVSLLCPLGRMKMTLPGCGVKCRHVQCFDVKSYLTMLFSSYKVSRKMPNVVCPVCNEKMEIKDLRLDQFFKNVLEKLKTKNVDREEIYIMANGKVRVDL